MNENQELQQAVLHGLLNQQQYAGNEMLAPKLLVNDEHGTIWEHLLDEFEKCQSFSIAVAFITQDMLTPFKAVMSELAARNVSGNLLTSDYLGFNAPEMFAELLKIPNLSVKITEVSGFHTKGYMFDNGDQQTMIVGSANLTRSAMLMLVRLYSTTKARLAAQMMISATTASIAPSMLSTMSLLSCVKLRLATSSSASSLAESVSRACWLSSVRRLMTAFHSGSLPNAAA